MPTSYISQKLKVFAAKAFRDSLRESTPRNVGYIFLSKTRDHDNEPSADDLTDTVYQEKEIWDDMIGAKRVLAKDIEFVIPKNVWTANTRYKQYDDRASLEDLLTLSYDGAEPVYPMYVINSEGNVYKCLCNNASARSQVEPTGNYSQNDGFIQTEFGGSTCYLWKYMYNVKDTNKFLENDWIPVPYISDLQNNSEYDFNTDNLIDGSLNKILVIDSGSGYFHSQINVNVFTAGATSLNITDDIDLTSSNTIKPGMLITGTGLLANTTYILPINPSFPKTIFLSEPTISNGGGSNVANRINVSTRVVITGDGTETTTSVILDANNGIRKIDVVTYGTDYSKANVFIYGSGTGAEARAILPPRLGHGHNPAVELGSTNVMILSRIGEIDATENTTFPVDVYFRQYGLLLNPYKYNGDVITVNNALDSVSMTLDLELLSFSNYQLGEKVYQGNIDDPTFFGYVVYQDASTLKLNNTFGEINLGRLLLGEVTTNQNRIVSIQTPDLLKYSGDIVYGKNIEKIQRSIAQAEQIKLVFKF